MGLLEVIEATLKALDLVEVRGKDNRRALSVAVDNLEELVRAIKDMPKHEDEVSGDDSNDEPREDV